MHVRVMLFSVLREAIGQRAVELTLDPPATGADLLEAMAREYPAFRQHRDAVRLAVNASYVHDDVTLSEGDEVALITPVSGG